MTSTLEALERAQQELKRADHLIYVSLKYTRTVDVLKSIIERLIGTLDAGFDALLYTAKTDGKIPAVPTLPRLKIEALKKAYEGSEPLKPYLQFYLLLRKLDKASYERAQEYRRHVTMKAALEESKVDITIDIISDYFHKTREFLTVVQQMVEKQ